jgi:single-strand DNA-binding protein
MFQQCMIIGNLGSDPEMRYLPDGRPVTNFSVATNRRWTNGDGSLGEEVAWFRVSCFGKLAETTNQYLEKGWQVMVVGRVKANAYSDREGVARASLDLIDAYELEEFRRRIETINSQLQSMGLERLHARTHAGFEIMVHASLLALSVINLN